MDTRDRHYRIAYNKMCDVCALLDQSPAQSVPNLPREKKKKRKMRKRGGECSSDEKGMWAEREGHDRIAYNTICDACASID